MPTHGRLEKLLPRLSDNWHQYRLYLEDPALPATHNAAEHLIGRLRTRSRSVCGFKTWHGLVNTFELCARQFT